MLRWLDEVALEQFCFMATSKTEIESGMSNRYRVLSDNPAAPESVQVVLKLALVLMKGKRKAYRV
jgi:hypothetical protein